jgi:large subunit ribosomal protein LP2
MRYAAAYVLATLSGNTSPDVATISKILGSVGVDCDNTKAQKVIDACKGKNIDEIIEAGTKKLSSLPTAGAPATGGSSGGAAAAAPTDAKKGGAKEEPKKAEKEKEESDGEGDDMVRIKEIFYLCFNKYFCFLGFRFIRLNLIKNRINHRLIYIKQIHIGIIRTCYVCFCLCVCFVLICYKRKERKKK